MFETGQQAKQFAIRVATFYGALFVVYGMHVPYLPVWLDWRGLSAGEISAIMSAPFFLRLAITPAVAVAADRNQSHRRLLIALAWISAITVVLLSQAASFWPIAMLVLIVMICNSTLMPLIETIAVAGVRSGGLDYGRMRLWGSLTFIAASIIGGMVIDARGGGAGVWLIAAGCVLTVIAAHLLPRPKAIARGAELKSAPAVRVPLWHSPEPRALLSRPAFRMFLLAGGLTQASHATLLTFGSLIWQGQGLSSSWIGTLWAVGVFAEVALFAWSGWVVARIGVVALFQIAAAAAIVRWAIMAFEPGLGVLLPLQVLHGLTFGASHIAAIYFLRSAVPKQVAGTAQALYATVAAGVAMGIATLASGWLYAVGGAHAYLAMGAVAVLALLAAVRLTALWTGEALLPDTVEDALAPLPPEAGVGR